MEKEKEEKEKNMHGINTLNNSGQYTNNCENTLTNNIMIIYINTRPLDYSTLTTAQYIVH